MTRLQIPYRSVLLEPRDIDPADFDDLCRPLLETSLSIPVVIEIAGVDRQYFLFLSEGQLYYAASVDGERSRVLPLREFFVQLRRMQFPQVVAYRMDLVLFHALLVWAQKKPDLKVASTLVDLDELLDRIETECENAVLTARDQSTLIVLRYQGGAAVACYRKRRDAARSGCDPREDFLVAVYTVSARHPLEINLFADLSVTHAEDARAVPAGFAGSISSLYLSPPARLVVRLKGRPLKTYSISAAELTIGRLPGNDIVIDNLSVSRAHAAVTMDGNAYRVRDLASKNGTMLNGVPVSSAELAPGDVITIGKYDIVFQAPTTEGAIPDDFDQTIIIPNFHGGASPQIPVSDRSAPPQAPRLFRRSAMDDYPLEKKTTVIGRTRDADIRLRGLFAPRVRVEIVRAGTDYVLHSSGRRSVRVNGEKTSEKTLEREDLITIGAEEFVFKE